MNQAFLDFKKSCGEEQIHVQTDKIDEIGEALTSFVPRCEEWLRKNVGSPAHGEVLELYFDALNYQKTAELYDSHYVTLAQLGERDTAVTLYCVDPSDFLGQALCRGTSAVLFSATLSPLPYYASVLGGTEESKLFALPSPFQPENLGIYLADRVSTLYKEREDTYETVAQLIMETVEAKVGNYMVFFPSYAYCREVYRRFLELSEGKIRSVIQESGLTEEEKEAFLAEFSEEPTESFAAFCVLGGMFSEGIDLRGTAHRRDCRGSGASPAESGAGCDPGLLRRKEPHGVCLRLSVPRDEQGSSGGRPGDPQRERPGSGSAHRPAVFKACVPAAFPGALEPFPPDLRR